MKTLLVTSRVTFVPRNYDELVCGLADNPHIAGLVVLENRRGVVAKALVLMVSGAFRTGARLLVNRLGRSPVRRRTAYQAAGKGIWEFDDVNSPALAELIQREGIDLVINARTRFIYKEPLLSLPRLGCVNIHHGLLPDERGTMCDLWALFDDREAGFTIHRMARKVDAGEILRRVVVLPAGHGLKDFGQYLARSVRQELSAVRTFLEDCAIGPVVGQENYPSPNKRFRRTPGPRSILAMRLRGMIL